MVTQLMIRKLILQ